MPEMPGLIGERQAVYRCFAAGDILLYVGTTGHLGRRLGQHAGSAWFADVLRIELEWHPDKDSAFYAERRAIRVERPRYNIVHKMLAVAPLATPRRLSTGIQEHLEMLLDAGTSVRKVAAALGVNNTIAHKWLKRLRQEGRVRLDGSGPAMRWRLIAPLEGSSIFAGRGSPEPDWAAFDLTPDFDALPEHLRDRARKLYDTNRERRTG